MAIESPYPTVRLVLENRTGRPLTAKQQLEYKLGDPIPYLVIVLREHEAGEGNDQLLNPGSQRALGEVGT